MERRMGQEVPGDSVGPEFKGCMCHQVSYHPSGRYWRLD